MLLEADAVLVERAGAGTGWTAPLVDGDGTANLTTTAFDLFFFSSFNKDTKDCKMQIIITVIHCEENTQNVTNWWLLAEQCEEVEAVAEEDGVLWRLDFAARLVFWLLL